MFFILRKLLLRLNLSSLLRFYFLLICLFSLHQAAFTQSADTVRMPTDTAGVRKDTVGLVADTSTVPAADTVINVEVAHRPALAILPWQLTWEGSLTQQIMAHHPFFDFVSRPVLIPSQYKRFEGKELLFYVVVSLVLLFALLRLAFAKYVYDLFRVFFRTTLKQRQIREQLMQTPLPSLVFNIFFVATAGLYSTFLLFHYFEYRPVENFWLLYLYCAAALCAIYLIKFIGLKIMGWMFNIRQAADSYIFIVFIINKVIGIFLLPFLVLLAFAQDPVYSIALVLSWAGLACLFLYRFVLGLTAVRNEVRFNLFHFILYIAAVEVAPLFLIYRVLLLVF